MKKLSIQDIEKTIREISEANQITFSDWFLAQIKMRLDVLEKKGAK